MSKFEKFTTTIFIIIAIVGTDKGWLPGLWATIFALIGAIGINKWIITKKREES